MSIVLDSCNTFIVVLVELGTCVKSLLRREKTVMCFYHSVHYFYLRLVGALFQAEKVTRLQLIVSQWFGCYTVLIFV